MQSVNSMKHFFAKRFYRLYKKDDVEEIYDSLSRKTIVFIRDEEIGKRLYNVIKILIKKKVVFENEYLCFSFSNYDASLKKCVKWFAIESPFGRCIHVFSNISSKIEKLKMIQEFVDDMAKLGLYLDKTIFDCTKCKNISGFLSYFINSEDEEVKEKSQGCMIEFIHYYLTGKNDFYDFYEKVDANILHSPHELPYSLPIFELCYKYYKKGFAIYDILYVLRKNQSSYRADIKCQIAINNDFSLHYKVVEETEKYTLYDNGLIIYKNVSKDLALFIRNSEYWKICNEYTFDLIKSYIINIKGNVIGVNISSVSDKRYESFSNLEFNNQKEVFDFINALLIFIDSFDFGKTIDFNSDGNSKLEDYIVCRKVIVCHYDFKIKTINNLFELLTQDRALIKSQIIELCFKYLKKYILKKYGALSNKDEILEKSEIKYLALNISESFANYFFDCSVKYGNIKEKFFAFLRDLKSSKNGNFYYDACWAYDPSVVKFISEYDVEKIYGKKTAKKVSTFLPDGRRLVVFNRSKKIKDFKKAKNTIKNDIINKLGDIEDKNISFIEVSEIIVDSEASDNMIGYITEPIIGESLSYETIKQLDNRELLRFAGYILSKFGQYYISWCKIRTEDYINYYIDYLESEDILIKVNIEITSNVEFIRWMFNRLMQDGYNPYAFVKLEIPYKTEIKKVWTSLADRLNHFCDKHKIYHESINCPICEEITHVLPRDFEKHVTKVFEDHVAVHYLINARQSLKIYKPAYRNEKVEETVEKMAALRLIAINKINFFQNCFIPCQKIVDSDSNFIGCGYESVNFEGANENKNVCVDLNDKNKLSNLPRLKSLIRLISQVKEIISNKMSFSENPFSHVFLNTKHKRQVQILNIEFISFNLAGQVNTQRWCVEYILNVIKNDGSLAQYFINPSKKFETLYMKLSEVESKLTKYCSIHKEYYSNGYLYCPKCIEPSVQNSFIEQKCKKEFEGKSYLNEGGESYIHSYGENCAVKIFKENEVNIERKIVLLFKILTKRKVLEEINARAKKYRYVIPRKLLIDTETKELFGYEMEFVKDAYPISILKDKVEVSKLGFLKNDILEILITVGRGIESLHQDANMYIGDLNGRNILFDIDKNIYFLDFDGMGIDDIVPEFCTDGYIDPVSKKNRDITKKDDWYSFAIQAFYYLTYTHPFNGIYYEVINGKNMLLEIPDKMERRISLLGNHGMKPPAVANDWQWMNPELIDVFLKIFEGDYRESIVPYLEAQYDSVGISLNQSATNKIYRINPKFVAYELNIFSNNVIKIFNPFAAVCEQDGQYYIQILKDENESLTPHNIMLPNLTVEKLLFSRDKKYAYIVFNNTKILCIDTTTYNRIYCENFEGSKNFVVNESSLYYSCYDGQKYEIKQITNLSDYDLKKSSFDVGSTYIAYFDVKFNSKFVIIKEATSNMDEVYCNSEKFCEIQYDNDIVRHYNIIYDEFTKSWLIVSSVGIVIVILKNGEKLEFKIPEFQAVDIEYISYVNGNIYIPKFNNLMIINVTTRKIKNMECTLIMTPNSIICNVNSEGFSVITGNKMYNVRKA